MAPPLSASSLGRALLLGLGAAGVVAGIGLLVASVRTLTGAFDCGTLRATECAFEEELARHHARLQLFTGIAFELLASACFLGLRARTRADHRGAASRGDAP